MTRGRVLMAVAAAATIAGGAWMWAERRSRGDDFPPRPAGDTTLLSFSRVEEAWRYSKGRGVTVAVLDWQFDPDSAVSASYVRPTSMIPGERIGDLKPWHGAWMLETVHAVAPEAALMPIIARGPHSGYENALPRGIKYAADHGASVVSSSMGPVENNQALREAVEYALSRGCIFVDVHPELVAQDGGQPRGCLPGECLDGIVHAGIVSVAPHPTRPEPGRDVYVWPYDLHSHYRDGWGLSNGPPTVAGVVALMLGANHDLTPAQVKRLLVGTSGMKDGFRVLDAEAAVRAAARLTAGAGRSNQ